MHTPSVDSLLICQNILRNEELGLCTLVNVYNVVVGRSFPLTLDGLHLYLLLMDGEGSFDLCIDLIDAASEHALTSFPLETQVLVDRLLPHEVMLCIDRILIPAAGRYLFRLRQQGQLVSMRDKPLLVFDSADGPQPQ